jgi:hypothetical protein
MLSIVILYVSISIPANIVFLFYPVMYFWSLQLYFAESFIRLGMEPD